MKIAYTVSTTEYGSDQLNRIPIPRLDGERLAKDLLDPETGIFDDVQSFLNPTSNEFRELTDNLFQYRKRYDLLMIYYCGVCLLDESGELVLAAFDTDPLDPVDSGVSTTFLVQRMDRSFSRQQILVFDWTIAGYKPQGTNIDLSRSLAGHGKWRKFAVNTLELSHELDVKNSSKKIQKTSFSTEFLRGLETGDADQDRDGLITLDEPYGYIKLRMVKQAPESLPQLLTFSENEPFIVARKVETKKRAMGVKWDVLFGTIAVPLVIVLFGWQCDALFASEMAILFLLFFLYLLLRID